VNSVGASQQRLYYLPFWLVQQLLPLLQHVASAGAVVYFAKHALPAELMFLGVSVPELVTDAVHFLAQATSYVCTPVSTVIQDMATESLWYAIAAWFLCTLAIRFLHSFLQQVSQRNDGSSPMSVVAVLFCVSICGWFALLPARPEHGENGDSYCAALNRVDYISNTFIISPVPRVVTAIYGMFAGGAGGEL
jgi:hypothetical protein